MNNLVILSTTGTSILTNCVAYISSSDNLDDFPILKEYIKNTEKDQNIKKDKGYSHQRIDIATVKYIEDNKNTLENQKTEIIKELTKYVNNDNIGGEKASAEINTIDKIIDQNNEENNQEIIIEFIVSDTFVNNLCLEVLQKYYIDKVNKIISNSIEGLGYESSSFVRSGLKSLVGKAIDSIEQHQEEQKKVVIAATGGFKAEFAYITMIAALYNIDLYYIHEAFDNLIRLPPIPIQIDHDFYFEYKTFFNWLEKKESERNWPSRNDIKNQFPNILQNEEILNFLESENDEYHLSPIVEILKKYYDQRRVLVVVDASIEDNIDLKSLSEYAHNFDNNCILYYISNRDKSNKNSLAANAGFDIRFVNMAIEKPKKIIQQIIIKEINKKKPVSLVIIAGNTTKLKLDQYSPIEVLLATGNFSRISIISNFGIIYLPHFSEIDNTLFNFDSIYHYLKSWNLDLVHDENKICIKIRYEYNYTKQKIIKILNELTNHIDYKIDNNNKIFEIHLNQN